LTDFSAGETVAEGIRVTRPARARQVLQAVRETGGQIVTVSEAQIIESLAALVSRGFFVEPTSAVAVAAARKLASRHGEIVVPLTGSGLKAPQTVARLLQSADN
jgi:threonine synthase